MRAQNKHTGYNRQFFTVAAALVAVSAVLYCSWPLGFVLNPAAMRGGLASELGAFGQPYNWLFDGSDVTSGILLITGVAVLLRVFRPNGYARLALVLLAFYGLCGALDAVLPMHCLPSEQACGSIWSDPLLIAHGACDFLGSTALLGTLVAAAIYVRRHSKRWSAWIWAVGIAGLVFAVMSGIVAVWGGPGYWAQRYYITLSCLWVVSVPFVLRPQPALAMQRASSNPARRK